MRLLGENRRMGPGHGHTVMDVDRGVIGRGSGRACSKMGRRGWRRV